MAAASEKEKAESDLQKIQTYHNEAFSLISQGLSLEEQCQPELALDMYKKGLKCMDIALNVRCDRPYCVGPKWDKARSLQQKMRKNMQPIKEQLQSLSQKDKSNADNPNVDEANGVSELPPSYDEACEQDRDSVPFSRRASCPVQSYKARNLQLNNTDHYVSEVSELYHIPHGVQLFYVSADGSVTTPSSPTSLHVYKFDDETKTASKGDLPTAWLQVGSWTYPLIPGQSPALETGYGAFIFPDVGNEQDAAAVGVILPSDIDYDSRREFEAILTSLTAFEEERPPSSGEDQIKHATLESPSFSDTLSRGLVTGAEYLSAGLVKGATFTGEYIHKGATKLKERLTPEPTPSTFDPKVKEGLKVAKSATGTVLKVSGFLVSKLGELTVALGKKVAPHIREQSTKLLSNTFKKDPDEAKHTVDGVIKVAAGGVQGFSTVYMGLENAARILAYSLSTETVNVVGHKYGAEAAEVVGNAVLSVGNLALTTRNVQTLGVKGIAKKTAKDAGKAVLKDYAEQIDKPGPSH